MFQNRRNWSEFEDKAIIALVKKHGTRNWAEISEKMSSKYGIENRTGKQCRERWHNHLNPDINKQAWTEKEEKAMFEAHQQHGNKWTQIARLFSGRTDNDIKNHFYSMLRRSLRRVNKLLGLRNSTQRIKLIKPSVLSRIFSNTDPTATDWKEISSALFEFSRTRSADGVPKGLDQSDRKRLERLIEKIAAYNEEYEQSQLERKESRKSEKLQAEAQNEKGDSEAQLGEWPAVKKQEHSQSEAPMPIPRKKSSNASSAKPKTKKIKRQPKPSKPYSPTVPAELSKKDSKRGRKKKEPLSNPSNSTQFQKNHTNLDPQTQQSQAQSLPQPLTRLKRRESELSIRLGEEVAPDFWQLPQLEMVSKRSSFNSDSRRASSSGSSSFFNSASPRMDLRIFARTPQCPTPNLSDMLAKNIMSFDWKANNQDLDQILCQTRRAIERRTA